MFVTVGNQSINSEAIVLVETTEGGTIYVTTLTYRPGVSGCGPIALTGRDAEAFRHWQREHEYDALAALEQHERKQADRAARRAEEDALLGIDRSACELVASR